MKLSLLEIIYCPACQGKFQLHNETEAHGEVQSGVLCCLQCSAEFPIRGYIPRLIENANYSSSWGKLWRETGEILRDSFTQIPFHYNVIHGQYSQQTNMQEEGFSPFGFAWPTDLTGQRILEVGPGTGNCTEHLVKTGAELVCIDMSDAIDVLPEALLIQPNINVIQANINNRVIEDNYFDRIWLFQVLQHTPSPDDTLKTMYRHLNHGGLISFTSYEGKYNPWYYRFTKRVNDRSAWKIIAYGTPKLVPIKYKIQKAKIPIVSNFLTKVLHPVDPRNLYFQTLEGDASEYIHGIIWDRTHDHDLLMKYIILNTFDRITPEYTNSADHVTNERWAREAGFSEIKSWGQSGVRVEAIKA